MDERKRLYHHEYNKQYYMKNKMAKQTTAEPKLRKMNSLAAKTQRIMKQLQENEERMNKFREELKSSHTL
jgi:hypothetical protein